MTAELQCFSPFAAREDGGEPSSPAANEAGGATEDRAFRPRPPEAPLAVTDGGPLDYGPYYAPAAQFYPALAKEPSVESQDSSTLSSPPSDVAAPPPAAPRGPDSLFQFSIGKILEDGGAAAASEVQGAQMAGFYSEGAVAARTDPDGPPPEQRHIRRIILSVNDKWHYCHNSEVLVGSRAMRDRHLRLLGYIILQLPYHELEKLNGIEEVKQYLHQKLLDVPL